MRMTQRCGTVERRRLDDRMEGPGDYETVGLDLQREARNATMAACCR